MVIITADIKIIIASQYFAGILLEQKEIYDQNLIIETVQCI